MKKKLLLLIIIFIYFLIPFFMDMGKYEYLTTSKSPYEDSNKSYSKYALIITEDKYYIYNRLTRTFSNDYSSFIKNINRQYMQYPNVCKYEEYIDYKSGVKCQISDKYLRVNLWYESGKEYDFDSVFIDNKGNVFLEYEKKEYRFGKYVAYGLFFEQSYGNYEIIQPNGNTYLIRSIDGEEIWDAFELQNRDKNGKKYDEVLYVDKFYIGKDNAIFMDFDAIINPLTKKIVIEHDDDIRVHDIYKDKYILLENEYFLEIRDIKNNVLVKYETDTKYHDMNFEKKGNVIYIHDREQKYIFDGSSILMIEN